MIDWIRTSLPIAALVAAPMLLQDAREKKDSPRDAKSADEEMVDYKGRKVSRAEKEALEKGLVKFKDRWVTAEDKKRLEKGLVQYHYRWVSAKDKEELEKGLLPYRGKWLPKEEVEPKRAEWADGWELSGSYYYVRTDAGEALGSDLLGALEAAQSEFRRFFLGAEPPRVKPRKKKIERDLPPELMPVYLFKNKSEYEGFCAEHGAPEQSSSPGFFDADTGLYGCYFDADAGRRQLFATSIGAMADAYCWYALDDRMPDWFAEGTRRYFEGIEWIDGKLKVGLPYVSLLRAIRQGRPMPLSRVLRVTLASLGNSDERWVWAGYGWALVHFFQSEAGAAYRQNWETLCNRYRSKANFVDMKDAGAANEAGARMFEEAFGKDLSALEGALKKHVESLPK